jgi:peptidoglycan/LPS O-acetylase OafA/YrhL
VYFWWRPFTDNGLYDALYFRTATRYDTIVAGILLAVVEARYGHRIGKWLESGSHRAALGVASLGCAWLLLRPDLFGEEHEQHVHLFTWGLVTSLMYLMLVPMVLHGSGAIVRFFSAPIFRQLATLGYGVYLVHIPVMNFVGVPIILHLVKRDVSLAFGWVLVFVVVVTLSWLVAYVLHVLVEKPSLRMREWLAA